MLVTWQNTGGAPTVGLEDYTSGATMSHPITSSLTFPELGEKYESVTSIPVIYNLLAPKGELNAHAISFPVARMKAVNAGVEYAYIWGGARYRDVFQWTWDAPHVTRSCLAITEFTGEIEKPDKSSTVIWHPCDYGNCSDDECSQEGIPRPPNHRKSPAP